MSDSEEARDKQELAVSQTGDGDTGEEVPVALSTTGGIPSSACPQGPGGLLQHPQHPTLSLPHPPKTFLLFLPALT